VPRRISCAAPFTASAHCFRAITAYLRTRPERTQSLHS
jgi:hypothetical protein